MADLFSIFINLLGVAKHLTTKTTYCRVRPDMAKLQAIRPAAMEFRILDVPKTHPDGVRALDYLAREPGASPEVSDERK